jgi:IS4 transposase
MFRITTFQEILKGLPRGSFDQIVKSHDADKYAKHFRHWEHLIAMMYAQISGAPSLRALEAGFNSQLTHHYHLGACPIKRTTLADANRLRSGDVFNDTAKALMQQVSSSQRRQSKEWLCLLDSTSITLKGREFDAWTKDNRTRHTQGIKLHVLYDPSSQAPQWHTISAANVNDVQKALEVPLQAGAIYVFDKGYCDYNWWHQIDQAGAKFVTRFKRNAGLTIEEERAIPADAVNLVLSDQVVRFTHTHPRGGRKNTYQQALRRITIVRDDKPTPLILATNDMDSSALTIAQRYKERWGIELFFKWIKQHLEVKRFLGRSENAVRIQLLTALISYLLIVLYKERHGLQQTLWQCLCMLRATLFQRPETELSDYRKRRQKQAFIEKTQMNLFA